jgi:hypothetical protein
MIVIPQAHPQHKGQLSSSFPTSNPPSLRQPTLLPVVKQRQAPSPQASLPLYHPLHLLQQRPHPPALPSHRLRSQPSLPQPQLERAMGRTRRTKGSMSRLQTLSPPPPSSPAPHSLPARMFGTRTQLPVSPMSTLPSPIPSDPVHERAATDSPTSPSTETPGLRDPRDSTASELHGSGSEDDFVAPLTRLPRASFNPSALRKHQRMFLTEIPKRSSHASVFVRELEDRQPQPHPCSTTVSCHTLCHALCLSSVYAHVDRCGRREMTTKFEFVSLSLFLFSLF